MKRLYRFVGFAILGVVAFSSCSKKNYTASFSPSRQAPVQKEVAAPVAVTEEVATPDAVASVEPIITEVAPAAPTLTTLIPAELAERVKDAPSFTKQEQKALKKELRKVIWKQARQSALKPANEKTAEDVVLIAFIISLFIPPLGVWYYQKKSFTTDFWIDLVLLITWVGSWIYAWLVIFDILSFA